jgi:fermentation-respiration switch protein FrsA (DUF1100 family)
MLLKHIQSMKKTIFVLIILSSILVTGCTHLFFQPQKELVHNPYLDMVKYDDISFKTADGLTLHGWLLKPEGKSSGTILYLHGNAENISTHVNNVLWLIPEGFTVFVFDYRGYGNSEGHPTIEGVHLDAEAALKAIINLSGNDGDHIIVLGQSLGGAVAVYTVANSPLKNHVKALVIDSAFSSYRAIAREKTAQFVITWPLQYPLSFLVNDHYGPDKWIRKVCPVPVLIIHGDQDTVIPLHHGTVLYGKASDPKEFWVVKGRGHTMAFAEKDIREKLVRYLKDKTAAR